MKLSRWIEATCWTAGLALLCSYAALRVHAEQERHAGVRAFQALRQMTVRDASPRNRSSPGAPVDQSLWSKSRIRAYRRTALQEVPEGILRIPALHLVVPIYPGTSRSVLDRGVGHVEGTGRLDSPGNAVIAGHRDGFFRVLERIRPGETLDVESLEGSRSYRVTRTRIVAPTDVSVLAPTAHPTVTLITCYPFYFVGPAPRRFIVRAELFRNRRQAPGVRTANPSQPEE